MPLSERIIPDRHAQEGEFRMNDGGRPWQDDPARRAVRAALDNAGLTLKQASRALGRNDAYLQQYLNRGSRGNCRKLQGFALRRLQASRPTR